MYYIWLFSLANLFNVYLIIRPDIRTLRGEGSLFLPHMGCGAKALSLGVMENETESGSLTAIRLP